MKFSGRLAMGQWTSD